MDVRLDVNRPRLLSFEAEGKEEFDGQRTTKGVW